MRLREAIEIEDRGYLSPCWIWQRSLNSGKGYGMQRAAGKVRRAHRLSYEAFRGPIPEGLITDHLCRVRECVNPVHLELVTVAINNHRGRAPNYVAARAGTCQRGHQMTPYANGRTQCKECRRARDRKAVA